MPVELTTNYLRIRVKEPELFIKGSFRTHDVGGRGGTKRIVAKLKSTRKFATQAWIFELEALKTRLSTNRTLRMIVTTLKQKDKEKVGIIISRL